MCVFVLGSDDRPPLPSGSDQPMEPASGMTSSCTHMQPSSMVHMPCIEEADTGAATGSNPEQQNGTQTTTTEQPEVTPSEGVEGGKEGGGEGEKEGGEGGTEGGEGGKEGGEGEKEGGEPGKEGGEPGKGGGNKDSKKKTEAKKPKKPTIKSIDLPVTEQTASLPKKELDEMREKEVSRSFGTGVYMSSVCVCGAG